MSKNSLLRAFERAALPPKAAATSGKPTPNQSTTENVSETTTASTGASAGRAVASTAEPPCEQGTAGRGATESTTEGREGSTRSRNPAPTQDSATEVLTVEAPQVLGHTQESDAREELGEDSQSQESYPGTPGPVILEKDVPDTTLFPPGTYPFADQPHTPNVMEVGADLDGYELTKADRLLDRVYGDHVHNNIGRHLDGGVKGDKAWQWLWRYVVELPLSPYRVPKGRIGRRFITLLTREFEQVRHRQFNSERPLIFAAVILQKSRRVTRAADIRRRLDERMDEWEKGNHNALFDDMADELRRTVWGPAQQESEDDALRRFNSSVLHGYLRKAVRGLTNRDGGGVLGPDEACTKTGRPVIDVLRDKHPPLRDPDLSGPNPGAFEGYGQLRTPEVVPVTITERDIARVAPKLSGAGGPSGVDAVALSNWLIRFGEESAALRTELAHWATWLCNESPPWAAYRALMACRLVALDKQPGVRPVGIGEVFRRLFAKCVVSRLGDKATTACGNLNLCAGLPAGIEGAIHAVAESHPLFSRADLPTVEVEPDADPPFTTQPESKGC